MVLLRRIGDRIVLHGYSTHKPGFTFLGVISLSHVHVNSSKLNLRKRYRLAIRGSICLIILLLPLSHRLNSLQIIGLVCALLWSIVAIETWGNAERCHVWFGEKGRREYMCKYNYKCYQGEELVPPNLEKTSDEDGDLIFGV